MRNKEIAEVTQLKKDIEKERIQKQEKRDKEKHDAQKII